MTPEREQFEEWWSNKQGLIPTQMKEGSWLAFADGLHRGKKMERDTLAAELDEAKKAAIRCANEVIEAVNAAHAAELAKAREAIAKMTQERDEAKAEQAEAWFLEQFAGEEKVRADALAAGLAKAEAALREAEDFVSAAFENFTTGDAEEATDVLRIIRAALAEAKPEEKEYTGREPTDYRHA